MARFIDPFYTNNFRDANTLTRLAMVRKPFNRSRFGPCASV